MVLFNYFSYKLLLKRSMKLPKGLVNYAMLSSFQRLFYEQMKSSVLCSDIYCPVDTAILLASYSLQEKYGNYNVLLQPKGFLKEQRVLPEKYVTRSSNLQPCFRPSQYNFVSVDSVFLYWLKVDKKCRLNCDVNALGGWSVALVVVFKGCMWSWLKRGLTFWMIDMSL